MLEIHYAQRADGARTAYGVMGKGPVLLIPPGALSNLEWWSEAPGASEFLAYLADHRTIVLYDRHGCGLSDRNRTNFTAEDDEMDIEAVVQALQPDSLDLFGISGGGWISMSFMAENPGRVRRLVLCATPFLRRPELRESLAAMRELLRADIDQYIRSLAVFFFPSGTDRATFNSFVRLNKASASQEVHEGIFLVDYDIEHLVEQVNVPTLVISRRGDQVAPFDMERDLAARIPAAQFVPLEGDAHFPWAGDWFSLARATVDFLDSDLGDQNNVAGTVSAKGSLSAREVEVLRLLAVGKSNKEIADDLVISLNTVNRHVSNIYAKTGAANRTQAAVYARDHHLFLTVH